MTDLNLPAFDQYRSQIDTFRKGGLSWEQLRDRGEKSLTSWTENLMWPKLTVQEWDSIVQAKRASEEAAFEASENEVRGDEDVIVGRDVDADVALSQNPLSSWQKYRQYLIEKKWSPTSVNSLGESSLKTLRKMSRHTKGNDEKIKGMVVGYVQSGKTASMSALISSGADNGYNFFIVLSGVMLNLLKQTSDRLFGDLNHPGNLQWIQLPQLSAKVDTQFKLENLLFHGNRRYFCVVLKNAAWLRSLLAWLNCAKGQWPNMKVVIIDDEADQASIDVNAGDPMAERTAINGKIVDLSNMDFGATNYVAYTATPYACFLNENFPESLYPASFIRTLPQSKEHFGPLQIFGNIDSEGLGIIRNIPDVERLGAPQSMSPQGTLVESIGWFLCCAAIFRLWRINSPVTMLVNVSRLRDDHSDLERSIIQIFKSKNLLNTEKCRNIYKRIGSLLSRESFSERFPDYGRLDDLRELPEFEEIRIHIEHLLSDLAYARTDERGDVVPTLGTIISVDNAEGTNGLIINGNSRRLKYPSQKAIEENISQAFIVIGGNTLSRGLTLEGLVSSYFDRDAGQGDTLMQMGRWFGYRRGYELLPRIWMPLVTQQKFDDLVELESTLRLDLADFQNDYLDPREYAPRVIKLAGNWLPTARNRMNGAQEVGGDYSGINTQTTLFRTSAREHNIQSLDHFVGELGKPIRSGAAKYYWKDVSSSRITAFLNDMRFHERSKIFKDIPRFNQWLENQNSDNRYTCWNVVLSGNQGDSDKRMVGGQLVHAIGRAIRTGLEDEVYIKIVRDPSDLLVDAEIPSPGKALSNEEINRIRTESNVGNKPQLLLYRVKTDDKEENDLVAVSIWIPRIAGANKARTYFQQQASLP